MSKNNPAKIEIVKIHFGQELFRVNYTLNGKPMMVSEDHVEKPFDKAMKAMIPHAIAIKELPEEAGKPYRCNVLSLTCSVKENGDNRTASISLTKITSAGKPDNLTTTARHYEAINPKVNLLPEDTRLAIIEACKQAKLFIKNHSDLKELYSQSELDIAA